MIIVSFLPIFRQLFVKFRVMAISAAILLLIFDTVYTQPPGGRGNRENYANQGNQPPQFAPARQETAQADGAQMVVTRQENGDVVTTTTSGDDIAVVRSAPGQEQSRQGGQGDYQPRQRGQRGQGPNGPGGFQPGQGAPGQPGQVPQPPDGQQGEPQPPGGSQPGPDGQPGQPGERPMGPRANRPTINTPNPDIRREDFNRTGENRELRIDFQGAPWRTVIEWFANEAGLSLELESAPPGSFSYRDETGKTYSIDETFSLLNSYLIRRNFLLVRTGKLLMLVNLVADGLPADLIRDVPLEKLDQVGDYEVVRVLFNLTGTTPDVVQAEIQQFLGPQGLAVQLPRSQQIYVTEFGGKLRTIREIIRGIDSPEVAAAFEIVTLNSVAPDIAVAQLKQLLPLADGDQTLRVMIDPTGKSILLSGRMDRVAAAKRLLKMVDIEVDRSDLKLKVYPIPSADPAIALAIVQTLLAGRPDVRVSLDRTTGSLAVQGRAEDHQKVGEAIAELEEGAFSIETVQLSRLSTTAAKEAIDNFFGATTSSSTTQRTGGFPFGGGGGGTTTTQSATGTVPAPIVTPVTSAKQLIIKGTKSQITQIKTLLTQMGEPNLFVNGPAMRSQVDFVHVPMSEKQAELVFQMAQQLWTQSGRGQVYIAAPGQVLSPTPGVRQQPLQFNNSQRQPFGTPYGQQQGYGQQPNQYAPLQPVPFYQQAPQQTPRSPDEMPLPSYLDNVPRDRIHVIDGYVGENVPPETQLQPRMPLPEQQPQSIPMQQDSAPIQTPPAPNTLQPASVVPLTSNRSLLEKHLDNLFAPTEIESDLPAMQPVSTPSNAVPVTPQTVPTEAHLTTQATQPLPYGGRFIPVAYRQEEEEQVEPVVPLPETDENVTELKTPEPKTTSNSENSSQLFGIVPNPNALAGNLPEQPDMPSPTFGAGRPAFFDRHGPPPGGPGPRGAVQDDLSVSVRPSGLFITGPPGVVDEFEELIRMLNSEAILKSQSTEFYFIKNAKADTIKSMLTTLLGTYSSTSSANDPLAGIPNDPLQALVAGTFGGSKIQATGPYDIYVDARSNMLIINANRVDHLTILELLPMLDRLGRTDDVMINAKPHLIKLEYMKAEDAETAVRTIFVENLQGANGAGRGGQQPNQPGGGRPGQQGAPQGGPQGNPFQMLMAGGPGAMAALGGGPQAFMQMMQQGRGGNQNQSIAQAEVQTMTLAVEKTTNSLIVYSPEELYLQVKSFVEELDRLSQNQEPTTGVVNYDQSSGAYLSSVLRAWTGNKVTVTNNSTSSTNRNMGNRGTQPGGFGGGMPGGMGGFGGGGMMMPGGAGARPGGMGGFGGGGRPGG